MPRRSARPTLDLARYRRVVPEWDRFVAACARPEPVVFRVRTGRVSEAELLERLGARGFRTEPVEGLPGFHRVVDGPGPVSLTLEHWAGLLYVQQASTGVAAPALGPRPGERVLDLCAAPGGKTTHACELMGEGGCVVASEIDERRIRGLLGNVYRLGHAGVLVVACDGRTFPGGASFDRVLVDAPCSGEGTVRRRSGEAPNPSRTFVSWVTRVQEELLERAVQLTRPGGTILYVTCTFAPEENEAVVSRVLARAPVELEPLRLAVPHAPGLTAFEGERFDPRLEGAARIYPHHLDSGGLFLAKLRKLEDGGGAPHAGRRGAGWSPVPAAFPESGEAPAAERHQDAQRHDDAQREKDAERNEEAARELVAAALEGLADRYGLERGFLERWRWTVRGGRVWMHTLDEWPLEAWPADSWRAIALGVRAVEMDTRGRPRPTNDFLRLASEHVRRAVMDVDAESLALLLRGSAVAVPEAPPGPVAIRSGGEVLGRGTVTSAGLVSEIPKARAADLLRALEAGGG